MDTLQAVATLLQQSLDHTQAKAAELQLRSVETHPGFGVTLLQVVASPNFDSNTKLAGALFFKNFIGRKWTNEDGEYQLSLEDVGNIKKESIRLMTLLPGNLQVQVGEAISIMADSDFPARWPDLFPDLVSSFSETNMVVNNGLLQVAHSICKRWRPLFRSDDLFIEIKLVLDLFCTPFLHLTQVVDKLIDENSSDKENLPVLFQTMNLITKLYFDLNCQDIPEFFEDNLNTFFKIFHKYLIYSNNLLNTVDEEEAGIVEKVKSGICEILQLYTQRYEEIFEPLLGEFVQSTWTLLTSVGLESKFDLLVGKALTFLTLVAKQPRRAEMFSSETILQQIIEKVVLPNITLRPVDEELFEDDPMEFIRRDLEGSDSDTRRRASSDFVRELNEKFESRVSHIVMGYITNFLQQYNSNKEVNWKAKDTANYLFSAIAIKGNITNSGVSATNLIVDIVGFFSQNVAPDLVDSSVCPILKVDAIKFIHTFRNQLTKEQLVDAFPRLSSLFSSDEYVIYTYAAVTVERILSIRKPGSSEPMFDKNDIGPVVQNLLGNLLNLILKGNTPEKLAENDFLMKCVMRVLITAQENVAEIGVALLQQLVNIINEISKNPSNPKFSHYAFESMGSLIKYVVPVHGAAVVENIVIPCFLNNILANEVTEFVPYAFQLLAFLLELTPAAEGLSQNYQALIKPLLSPVLWDTRGNIPAIVRLLRCIISHGSDHIVATNTIVPLLGVFQKLLASRANDVYGFDLLESIFLYVPYDRLKEYTKQVAILFLQRLQTSKTEKYVIRLTKFIYYIASLNTPGLGPVLAVNIFDEAQNGIFGEILSQFLLPSTLKIQTIKDRKIATVGLTNILLQNPKFTGGEYSARLIPALEILIETLSSDLAVASEQDNKIEVDFEASAFGSSFSKLNTTAVRSVDHLSSIPSSKDYLVAELKKINTQSNGQFNVILGQLSENAKQNLTSFGFA
ncbi:Cse1-domain-containing protein [Nadsonia fulvescens var. elongata DSM 6958]|uniref:Cse1-domain-containing protein n=1 Tax=Nadsonia fulvescens var. elongata DSM 6958 TaxID=857566 RepID=A0A1E3PNB3_9ASCO|nr:Cse1-domain-containing protein [Nadsonia fulvescens var. elongata DSM 6958]